MIFLTNLKHLFRKPEFYFFAILLITGLFVYDDYGLSFDEETSRLLNGYINYDFITTQQREPLLFSNEKYHGPAFEILLVFIEKIFNITDTRSIYFMRHLCTFLLFFIAVILIFAAAKKYFGNTNAALLACIFLVLSPRIFAESFYNSKDLAFLSVFAMSIFTLLRFQKKQSIGNAALHAFMCGFLVDIRIIGIIIPVLTIGMFVLDLIHNIFSGQKLVIRPLAYGIFFVLFCGFVVLFWPVLWIKPLSYFIAAFAEMGHYPWGGNVLYIGEKINSVALPWHYIPVWLGITTPVFYSVLFLTGIVFISGKFSKNILGFYRERKEDLLILACFFIPLLSVILFHSVVYDGWRHLYFIYPAFILIAVKGFVSLENYISDKGFLRLRKIVFAVTAVFLANILYRMISTHPYQNVYFNYLAGNPAGKFELDYWGLSYRQGLEHILHTDKSDSIVIASSDYPAELNMQILPYEDRVRMHFSGCPQCSDYYLDNFRMSSFMTEKDKPLFLITAGSTNILAGYNTGKGRSVLKKVLEVTNDFENTYPDWSAGNVTEAGSFSYSGKFVSKMDSRFPFSEEFSIPVDSITDRTHYVLVKVALWKYNFESDFKAVAVLSIGGKKSENAFIYQTFKLNPLMENKKEEWKKVTFEVILPGNIPPGQTMKIYAFSPGNTKIYVDDFSIEISEILN